MTTGWMLPPEAFEYIRQNIPRGSNILEFGSGEGSTILSEYYKVTSIEHDSDWLGVSPVNYIHAKIVSNQTSISLDEKGWYDIASIRGKIPSDIDFIIIDGPPGNIGRSGILGYLDLIPSGVNLLIDDVDRDAEKNLMIVISKKLGMEIELFESELTRADGTPRAFAILCSRNEG